MSRVLSFKADCVENIHMSAAAKKPANEIDEIIAIFNQFPLFEEFPEHLVKELAASSEFVQIPAKAVILNQGQVNDHLYFLVDGDVGVYVDGGRVSRMQRKGDLLGEMSVISNKPVTATIIAESKVTLLRVNSTWLLNLNGPNRDLYRAIIYRIYATVLADKLQVTNQKAKHFEEMSVELKKAQGELREINENLERKVEERTLRLEQQNAELMVGKRKVEELLNNKKILFRRLDELQKEQLTPLKNFLDDYRKMSPGEPAINNARALVYEVQKLLWPIVAQYSSEQAVQGKKVLVADANKRQQAVARMALGGTGVVLDVVGTFEEGRAKIDDKKFDLVIFDTTNSELGNYVKERSPETPTVLMTSEEIPKYLPYLKTLKKVPHIVSREESDRTFTVKNILTTATKLLSEDFFGLEKYLAWGVDIQTLDVAGSKERTQAIDEVDNYFEKIGVRRANRDRMRAVLEELLMNAIYDAPTDEDGNAVFNHLPRSQDVSLPPEHRPMVRYATDGMLIALSVQDPFGTLKGSVILEYLEHNYAGTADGLNIQKGKGGAGRGLHLIVENSDLVVFNVSPGKVTEVIALFNVEVREKANLNPSFHLFVKGQ